MNGQIIKMADGFKYLGAYIAGNITFKELLTTFLGNAYNTFTCHAGFWSGP